MQLKSFTGFHSFCLSLLSSGSCDMQSQVSARGKAQNNVLEVRDVSQKMQI